MKKIIALVTLLLVSASTMIYAQETSEDARRTERKAERDRLKAEEKAADMLAYNKAIQAINDKQFVLEATQVIFKRGRSVFVTSNTNFIMLNDNRASVQIAFNSPYAGPNGIGGITVDGNANKVQIKTSKKGNVSVSFSVQGIGISAQVFISIPYGTNRASVSITPNFNSNTLTLNGNLIPLSESNVYKGRSL